MTDPMDIALIACETERAQLEAEVEHLRQQNAALSGRDRWVGKFEIVVDESTTYPRSRSCCDRCSGPLHVRFYPEDKRTYFDCWACLVTYVGRDDCLRFEEHQQHYRAALAQAEPEEPK